LQILNRTYHNFINFYFSTIKTELKGRLPDFIILGTQKGGTTSLYNYLINHSKISGGSRREIHFFDKYYEKGVHWYKNNFLNSNENILTCECSPDYIHHPLIAKRIKNILPKSKLIILLRDPVERAISNYKHNIYIGKYKKNMTIEEIIDKEKIYIKKEKNKINLKRTYYSRKFKYYSLLDRGIYHKQIKRYFNLFNKNQIHIIFSEKLFFNTQEELKKVFEFLKLNNENVPCTKIYNKSKIDYEVNKTTRNKLENFFLPHNKKLYRTLNSKFRW